MKFIRKYLLWENTVNLAISMVVVMIVLPGCAQCKSIALSEIKHNTIRIGTYNVKNLFDGMDDPLKLDDQIPEPQRLKAISEIIHRIDCDVLALQEVENLDILNWFNDEYLHGRYSNAILVEGNDPRGIDVAVLSNMEIKNVVSFRERDIYVAANHEFSKFSRDLLAVVWEGPDGRQWTLLTTHLKAGGMILDRERRKSQATAIAEIIREQGYVDKWGRGITILAGDLNAEPWEDDLAALSRVPFSDPGRDLPYRYTHASRKTLDYILLSPEADLRYIIGSYTVYRDYPASIASDHYPVFLDLWY